MSTKACVRCGGEYPATADHFHVTGAGYLRNICKQCRRPMEARRSKDRQERNRSPHARQLADLRARGRRRCSKCGGEFPLTEEHFYREAVRSGGFSHWCRACKGAINKASVRRQRARKRQRLLAEEAS